MSRKCLPTVAIRPGLRVNDPCVFLLAVHLGEEQGQQKTPVEIGVITFATLKHNHSQTDHERCFSS